MTTDGSTNYALIALIATVPVTIVMLFLILRGYDIIIILRKRKKDEE